MQLVARGKCDDEGFAQGIREALGRIPKRSRRKIIEYAVSDGYVNRGLRFEALNWWPGMGNCVGQNMKSGHVIRLRAPHVQLHTADLLAETIHTTCHELAHTEQHAEGRQFATSNECERDVEARLRKWGFDDQSEKKIIKKDLLITLKDVRRTARSVEKYVRSSEGPSGNYAHLALTNASQALTRIDRTFDRWFGFD
jgi:hypothetical protein